MRPSAAAGRGRRHGTGTNFDYPWRGPDALPAADTGVGMPSHHAGSCLLLGTLLGGFAIAQTPAEDEARIEALMNPSAVLASAQAPASHAPATVDDSINETPIVAAVVAPTLDANDSWLAAPQQDAGLEFSALPRLVGQRVAIIMSQGKERVGTIVAADAKQVTLRITRKGGSASYAIPREKIERVEGR